MECSAYCRVQCKKVMKAISGVNEEVISEEDHPSAAWSGYRGVSHLGYQQTSDSGKTVELDKEFDVIILMTMNCSWFHIADVLYARQAIVL